MDKTVKDILTDLNSDSKLKIEQDLLEIEKKIFSLDMNVDSNETLIFKTQWTIEENRRMILNNYHAAFSVNSKLANENTRSIFQNRNAILSRYKIVSDEEANYLEYQKKKSKLVNSNDIKETISKVANIPASTVKSNEKETRCG